jgi:hypothetical protein
LIRSINYQDLTDNLLGKKKTISSCQEMAVSQFDRRSAPDATLAGSFRDQPADIAMIDKTNAAGGRNEPGILAMAGAP